MKTDKYLNELVIDRKKWGRARLLRTEKEFGVNDPDNGKMCCMGFYCVAAGVNLQLTPGGGYPYSLPAEEQAKLPTWMISYDTLPNEVPDWRKLAGINDDTCLMSQSEKEEAITKIFAEHGTKVTFVG